MIDRKDWVISFLAILCMVVVMFPRITSSHVQTAQLSPQKVGYDPWLDHNEDGIINILDIAPVAMIFGVEGDPARTVSVMNSHYGWYSNETIEPRHAWGFLNETAGYRQVNIRVTSNATVNVFVYFGILGVEWHYVTSQDQFEIQMDETVFKTYDVKGPTLQLVFFNPSQTTEAYIFVALYVTT